MSHYTRREFLKTGLAAGTLAATGTLLAATRQTATEWVTLGKSGVKVTRLAFGTGSISGQVQRDLGQGRIHQPRPLRLRSRHSLLRNRRILR